MQRQTKLNSQEQEQTQQPSAAQQTQEAAAREFATPEEMLRHDALHTPVPPTIAHRLQESIGKTPARTQSWWRRLLGGSNQ
jgi:NAD-dependent oxidoreductase involved in siderophore biosynthesis